MITDQVRDEKRFNMFKPTSVIGQLVQMEPKRIILAEINSAPRNIFNSG